MKLAISTDGDFVSPHFGRCPTFTIVDIEGGTAKNIKQLDNPGHHPGYIPKFLSDKGVKVIIAGGIGRRAQGFFDELGMTAIIGVSGRVDDVIKEFINGTLKSGESLCSPGAGKGYGVEKDECDHE